MTHSSVRPTARSAFATAPLHEARACEAGVGGAGKRNASEGPNRCQPGPESPSGSAIRKPSCTAGSQMLRVDARGVRHRCKGGCNKSHVRLSQLSYQAHVCRWTLRQVRRRLPCACRRSRCCRCVRIKNAWITNGGSIVCKACQRRHLRDTSRNLRLACRVMRCMRSSADENCRKIWQWQSLRSK